MEPETCFQPLHRDYYAAETRAPSTIDVSGEMMVANEISEPSSFVHGRFVH
jgi:hypothetical protein